ncbi:uncharacterized protein LOC106153239 [Lingula anatina]|uniref:Uncharacterized protein LOC106153239 n=1 Tax=Lingula anatina TaxID=7574 RepID=A0A1S3HBP0_LINAN|nr:uncharacterized protein LOC106153239 [Lingula anatina]|eukprot:XP_013382544.1 uncharacterized protein LOC106153239 [Lingula anatina]
MSLAPRNPTRDSTNRSKRRRRREREQTFDSINSHTESGVDVEYEGLARRVNDIPVGDLRNSPKFNVDDVPRFLPVGCLNFLKRKGILLGEGTFGKVYFAKEKQSDLPVAVKVFKDQTDFDLAVREARITAALSESGIGPKFIGLVDLSSVKFLKKGIKKKKYHALGMVTQFIGDPVNRKTITLSDALTTLPKQVQDISLVIDWLRLFVKLAMKLAKLHNLGFVFNDLHDDNVILSEPIDDNTDVFIIDYGKVTVSGSSFGFSYYVDPSERKKHVLRYPQHPPEYFEGKPSTASSDVYSFGALLKAADMPKWLNITDLVDDCLAVQRSERPTMDEVEKKLRQCLKTLPMLFKRR